MHGIIRRSSSFNTGRIEHLYKDQHEKQVKLFLHYGDLTDSSNLFHIISTVRPAEVYNRSHVARQVSFEMSEYTAGADGVGTLRLLNAIRSAGLEKSTRSTRRPPRTLRQGPGDPAERNHALLPRSPYGQAARLLDAH